LKRVKRRYLALKVECEALPNEREFTDAVWAAVTRLYGEVGASQAALSLIDFDVEHKTAVIRVSLATLDMVKASLATIISIAGKEASVRVSSISGTIRALHSNRG